MATVRPLTDRDLDAVLAHLRPTEESSTFLVGNAREGGLGQGGGPARSTWLGAFEGGTLLGLAVYTDVHGSLLPACGGHAAALVPALAARCPRPRQLVGTRARVEEAMVHAPADWRTSHRALETLLVLRWEDYVPPAARDARVVAPADAATVAALIGIIEEENAHPTDPVRNLERAQRMTEAGDFFGTAEGPRLVSVSCEASSTGRFVHVGATATARDRRRRGYAAACVAAVVERARAAGRAREGAVLFTGQANAPAIALYSRLGFRAAGDFELRHIEPR